MTNRFCIILCCLLTALCAGAQRPVFKDKFDDAIPVLNMGTFHMGYTPDAAKVDFDEHNRNNQQTVRAIARQLAAFRPTVIIVERVPERNEALLEDYLDYVKHPDKTFKNPNEIQLLAYEVGRLSGAVKIFGIDFHENYNYSIFNQLQNRVDTQTIPRYRAMITKVKNQLGEDSMTVRNRLLLLNHPQSLDYLINVNADLLTYASTKGNAEGAQEAAKFYHRNLVMFSNLNQLPLSGNDRIFILMGAGHTAFFNDFFRRSPRYRPVNIFDYLK
ncbi:DUF5694 domain-containing protein [Niabella beijingensis]|uniref:DUF5694 domain-containing protein n=1 Tax=Niabella beijingensis TaxID=2872700 RepID=UPI001CBF1B66|nr:DUF5694 domain-containing protein [Niabella beijingensis]MBZ4189256.1 DUF5694 domain-containing protein [Niabella beijingensis]